ncbi:MAG: phosphotransferase [Actinomycetota bacterium]
MGQIPTSIDDIDAAWMSNALGQPVAEVTHEQIGEGVGVSSAVYRATLTGAGLDTVIVKLPALAEEAVFTSAVLRMYIREVQFFENLASRSPIRVPAGHYGAVDLETSAFVQVMEDMGSMRMVDQNEGMTIDDAKRAIDELARWHAEWWGDADAAVERGDAVCLSDPIYPAVLPMVFAEGWEKVNAAMTVDPVIAKVGPGWSDWMPGALASLAGAPNTVIHGDYRADNILFDDDNGVVLLDFQLTGRGTASYDLAYFVTQSLAPDVAATHETALFNRWIDGLVSSGVPEGETTSLWDRYREAALFCLVYPIVASRGMDLEDERQHDLVDNMNTRFVRAVDQLNLADLMR